MKDVIKTPCRYEFRLMKAVDIKRKCIHIAHNSIVQKPNGELAVWDAVQNMAVTSDKNGAGGAEHFRDDDELLLKFTPHTLAFHYLRNL